MSPTSLVPFNRMQIQFSQPNISWIIHNEHFYKQNKVYSLSWAEEEFWNKMSDPKKGYIGIRAKGDNAEMIAAKEKDLTVGML